MLLKTDQPPEYCRFGQKFFERPVLPAGMAGSGQLAERVGELVAECAAEFAAKPGTCRGRPWSWRCNIGRLPCLACAW
ncbi:MAG: hypothetical protein D3M94_02965 [Rhodocyclales bacterium GT-UBC]|nr:MAG: hypothetical protein D3M94_02965 [Rhodocyclales bacterium GT-UBC]